MVLTGSEQDLKSIEEQVETERQRHNIIIADSQRLKQSLAMVNEELKSSLAQLETVKEKITVAEAEQVRLEQKNKQLKEYNDDFLKKIETAKSEHDAIVLNNLSAQKEIQSAKAASEQLELRLKEREKALAFIEKDITDRHSSLEEKHKRIREFAASL